MFFRFKQNNSGGSFVFKPERGLSVEVYIEADDAEEAMCKAESLGIYFNGVDSGMDCSCCGDRWYEPWDSDARETPPTHVVGYYKWIDKGPEGFVHFRSGAIVPLKFEKIQL